MDEHPRIDNAPGLHWRHARGRWSAHWIARHDLVRRGWRPSRVPLWEGIAPTDTDRLHISDACNQLQSDMLVWGRGGIPVCGLFDGSLAGLIAAYRTDPDSGYQKLRYRTRQSYDGLCRRIEQEHGGELLENIRARTFLRWHEEWTRSGVSMAHHLMGVLRTIFTFGRTLLDEQDQRLGGHCVRLGAVLHDMRFRGTGARKAALTAAQANLIRAKAHEMGLPSIALAQAFQFECTLRQRDVIGEWIPHEDPSELTEIMDGGYKWVRGLRWSEIDEHLILRHVTSKRGKELVVDLRNAPMVLEELGGRELPASGPVVVREKTRLPWSDRDFRNAWRTVADACGIPRDVFNMDSRAGAITEATAAGAALEDIRHAATHSDIKMTARYSRDSEEKISGVMKKRAAFRLLKKA